MMFREGSRVAAEGIGWLSVQIAEDRSCRDLIDHSRRAVLARQLGRYRVFPNRLFQVPARFLGILFYNENGELIMGVRVPGIDIQDALELQTGFIKTGQMAE